MLNLWYNYEEMDKNLNKFSKVFISENSSVPVVGLGVYKMNLQGETKQAVKMALNAGYRMIDTAARYKNEQEVGEALRGYGLLREEYFVTTKVWNADQGYESTLKAIDTSLEKLGFSYVDLYLVHWPTASEDLSESINKRAETWRAMEEILASGKAKAIGVSNFTIKHLKEMENYANIMPAVNQVEFHPCLYQKELLSYCKEKNITLVAYSPLLHGEKMDTEPFTNISKRYNKTPAQVMLRWSLQHGVVIIPKSSKENHIKENIDIFDFEINASDMEVIDMCANEVRIMPDPELLS